MSRDAIRDGLALIEAVHWGDLKAVRCLLDNGDTRARPSSSRARLTTWSRI